MDTGIRFPCLNLLIISSEISPRETNCSPPKISNIPKNSRGLFDNGWPKNSFR